MAELEKITVVFSGEAAGLLNTYSQLGQSAQQFGATVTATANATVAGHNALSAALTRTQTIMQGAARIAAALGVAYAGMKLSEIAQSALMAAARFETLGVVMNQLAKNTNFSAVQLQEYALGVERTGISMTGAREAILRMIQSNVDLAASSRLARVAQDAAVIGNTNSTEAFERLIHGIQSAQVEVLRTIGINVVFETSYAKLATQLGKTADALTEEERTQARVNAVLEAGARITGAYAAAMDTAGKQLNSMRRFIDDINTNLGRVFLPVFTSTIKVIAEGLKNVSEVLGSKTSTAMLDHIGNVMRDVAQTIAPVTAAIAAAFGVALVVSAGRAVMAIGAVKAAIAGIGAAFFGLPGIIAGALTLLIGLFGKLSLSTSWVESDFRKAKEQADNYNASLSSSVAQVGQLTEAQKALARARAEEALAARQQAIADQEAMIARARAGLNASMGMLSGGTGVGRIPSFTRPPDESVLTGPASQDFRVALEQLRRAVDDFRNTTLPADEALAKFTARFFELQNAVKNRSAWDNVVGDIGKFVTVIVSGSAELQRMVSEFEKAKAALSTSSFQTKPLAEIINQVNQVLADSGVKFSEQLGKIITTDAAKAAGELAAVNTAITNIQARMAAVQLEMMKLPQEGAAWNEKLAESNALMRALVSLTTYLGTVARNVRESLRTPFDIALQAAQDRLDLANAGTNALARARVQAQQQMRDRLADSNFGRGLDEATRQSQALMIYQKEIAAAAKEYSNSLSDSAAAARVLAEYAQRVAEAEGDGAYAARQARNEMERAQAAAQGNANLAELSAKHRAAEAEALGKVLANIKLVNRESESRIASAMAQMSGPIAVQQNALAQEVERLRRELGPAAEDAELLKRALESINQKAVADAISSTAQLTANMQNQVMLAEVELRTLGMSNAERDKQLALAQALLPTQQALSMNLLPEQVAQLEAAASAATKLADAYGVVKGNIETAKTVQEAFKQAGDAIGKAFSDAIIKGEKLQKVLQSLLSTLLEIFAKQIVFAPFSNMFGNLGSAVSKWLDNINLGSLFGGGSGGSGAAGFNWGWFFAQGGALSARGLEPYRNSVVSQPTIFPFASGGTFGLMGEAGPEAILPLVRMPSGALGVRALPESRTQGHVGKTNVEVNVYAPPGSKVEQSRRSQDGKEQVDIYIDQTVANSIRPGTKTYRAMREVFGLNQMVTRR